MGKSASSAKKLNKESEGDGSSVDQQILATLQEILSSLRSIESHMPVDTLTIAREGHARRQGRKPRRLPTPRDDRATAASPLDIVPCQGRT
jgi:hypothetical protein